ncbi:MAG TPA: hypothetical protein VLA02_11110 [Reyranella sp.]|nr:hypothetical protein [Reyranella sp.]
MTEAGDLVHGEAATAAARMDARGGAARRRTGLAVRSKFRLFAAGRWPLGVESSRLVLF